MYPLAFLGNVGPWEVLVVGIIALVIFGKRLPEVAKSLGRSVTSFKQGMSEVQDEIDRPAEKEKDKDETPKADAGSPLAG